MTRRKTDRRGTTKKQGDRRNSEPIAVTLENLLALSSLVSAIITESKYGNVRDFANGLLALREPENQPVLKRLVLEVVRLARERDDGVVHLQFPNGEIATVDADGITPIEQQIIACGLTDESAWITSEHFPSRFGNWKIDVQAVCYGRRFDGIDDVINHMRTFNHAPCELTEFMGLVRRFPGFFFKSGKQFSMACLGTLWDGAKGDKGYVSLEVDRQCTEMVMSWESVHFLANTFFVVTNDFASRPETAASPAATQ